MGTDEPITGYLSDGNQTIAWVSHGLRDLVELLDDGKDVTGWTATDKVVGRAAALLYRKAQVGYVRAGVLSEPARKELDGAGIGVTGTQIVPDILNRERDGRCPMEVAVAETSDPERAFESIKELLGV
ncbi:MAG: DUF1893 domain-containing protein [Propionibacteriaceae bacterium]|jgi:hypothetical protein|nr:DUF1893 domain-containing protein [Propionibacteriaceae bacterium]